MLQPQPQPQSPGTADAIQDTLLARLEAMQPARRLGLAVSGGRDSLSLAHRLAGWIGATGREALVLVVDHGLRPGSAGEAQQAARAARAFGYRAAVLGGPPPVGGGPPGGGNLLAQARRRRFRLLVAACRARGIRDLVLAQHQDDQAETLLIRLGRGAGLDGLACMEETGSMDGVRLLRPALCVPGAGLRVPLACWVEDPSNHAPRFDRARLRAHRDVLRRGGLGNAGLAATVAVLQRDRALVGAQVQAWMRDRCWLDVRMGLAHCRLQDMPASVALRAVGILLTLLAGRPDGPRGRAVEALLAWARSSRPGEAGVGQGAVRTLHHCRIVRGHPDAGEGVGLWLSRLADSLPAPEAAWPGARRLCWDERLVWRPHGQAGRARLQLGVLGQAACPVGAVPGLEQHLRTVLAAIPGPVGVRASLPAILDPAGDPVALPGTGWVHPDRPHPGPVEPAARPARYQEAMPSPFPAGMACVPDCPGCIGWGPTGGVSNPAS